MNDDNKMKYGECNSFEKGTEFLINLFKRLELATIKYCIERNYEDYPHVITGDVDIVVCRKDLNAAVSATLFVAKDLHWGSFVVYSGYQAAHIGFYTDVYPSRFVLVIEFFVGGTWRGLPFLSSDRVINMRQKYGAYWKPNPAHEAIITLVHHLLYNGRVFKKYHKKIRALIDESPSTFTQEISYSLGLSLAGTLTELVQAEDWKGLENQCRMLRWKFIARSLFSRPCQSLTGVYKVVKDTRRKPEGVIISLEKFKNNSDVFLADEIIKLAVQWHIFVPPSREKIMLHSHDALKLIKSVLVSGGVAVVINPLGAKLSLSLRFSIIHVEEKEGTLSVRVGSTEPHRLLSKKLASFEIWNMILKYRSRALEGSV